MFKKLVVGALAAGIVLTGGIGAASANVYIPYDECYSSHVSYNNGVYTKYLVQPGDKFNNVYKEDGITFYFKGWKKLSCGKYVALYEGRK
ncbi:hypothetical protein COD82_28610 [Bacillus cereus]|jgi:hypothetical protein|uniref:LCI fold domain-containing protein n=1 Tax=Bacillus cereus TaxID=1396 RepID=A0A9X6SVJ3_BACCE|nr:MULTISPECIES: LCI fold-containing protein [Bacillus]HDR7705633.1 hypothetical protein [Bacillus thuringiensis]EEL58158.1 hypothetical protein bcere0023_2040 [Bacillus cereus Rock4-2]KAF6698006.1 hypothetical protein HFD78_18550 [Bacillus sp. EKM501B]KMP50449.1 hypothetical protein TU59_21290 [Bacillus cereus]MDA2412068.1 LCI family antimicrobial peptide [Bacillus cereus]